MPAIGIPSGRPFTPLVVATTSAEPRIAGSSERGTPNRSHSAGSHSRERRSMSSVRDAFVTSVTCAVFPERRLTSALSIVPNARSPFFARASAPFTLSRSQRIFVAEK
jgi:hypothetical protein